MAIKTHLVDGILNYEVKVKARAPGDRTIQVQRQDCGTLKADLDPEEIRKKLQRIEMRLYGDARAEVALRLGAGMTWKSLVKKWEIEALGDPHVLEVLSLCDRSASGYLQAINDHTDGWFDRPASEITSADFELLVLAMKKAGYSNSTIYNVKSAVNCCYKWGIKNRYIPKVTVPPTYGCMISRKNSRRPEVLNFTQICKLLSEAERLKHPWFRVWQWVLHTGMRSGEAYAAKVRDLDREEKRIMLDTKYNFDSKKEEQLKDHEWRQVPINEELDMVLQESGVWEMKPDEYLLPRIVGWRNGEAARTLRTFCEEINVPSICFHTLRACWATQLLRNGVAAAKVMIMGGWSDLETMQVYLRRAGIEIEGATDSLSFKSKERPARILRVVGNLEGV